MILSNRRKYDALSGDRLLRNDLNTETKKFTDVSPQAGIYQSNLGYGLGVAIADLNNDGWDDIYIGNDFHENDYYYINNGNGSFIESGANYFVIIAASAWATTLQTLTMMAGGYCYR